jgi:hypothetical protein
MFISKLFAALAVLATLSGTAYAESEADTIFCRTAEPVFEAIPAALREDVKNNSDEAFFTLTDTLIGNGVCAELPATDVVFNTEEDGYCDDLVRACFLRGAAHAKLPPEAGSGFAEGFAIRATSPYNGETALAEAAAVPTCATIAVQPCTDIDEGDYE